MSRSRRPSSKRPNPPWIDDDMWYCTRGRTARLRDWPTIASFAPDLDPIAAGDYYMDHCGPYCRCFYDENLDGRDLHPVELRVSFLERLVAPYLLPATNLFSVATK